MTLRWITVAFMVLLASCANERAITGGPEDKEAPVILWATPENESTSVDRQTEIYIRFSEQMQRSTLEAAVQVWPRPASGFEVKTGWTWMRIRFPEALDSAETYLLTLQKSASDLRGNGLEAPYVMAFSTGKDINDGVVQGRLHGSKEVLKNGELLLYRVFDTELDVLRQEPADYVIQPDDEGFFRLPYLDMRSYMLFYHWDRNRNKEIDGDDLFGRPDMASVRATPDSNAAAYDIWPDLVPLEALRLLGASMYGPHQLQVRGDRKVDITRQTELELLVNGVDVPILGISDQAGDEFALNLHLAGLLNDSSQVWLQSFLDTSGTYLNSDTLQMKRADESDTLALQKLQVTWEGGHTERFPSDPVELSIRGTVPYTLTGDSIMHLVDKAVDSVRIYGSVRQISTTHWLFSPDSLPVSGTRFSWELQTAAIATDYPSEIDSLMGGQVNSISPDSLGSMRIMHMGFFTMHAILTGKDVERTFTIKPGEEKVVDELPAGEYRLMGFEDRDGDGIYSSGGLGPAARAETFYTYPEQIRVRARWETDLGIWRYRR